MGFMFVCRWCRDANFWSLICYHCKTVCPTIYSLEPLATLLLPAIYYWLWHASPVSKLIYPKKSWEEDTDTDNIHKQKNQKGNTRCVVFLSKNWGNAKKGQRCSALLQLIVRCPRKCCVGVRWRKSDASDAVHMTHQIRRPIQSPQRASSFFISQAQFWSIHTMLSDLRKQCITKSPHFTCTNKTKSHELPNFFSWYYLLYRCYTVTPPVKKERLLSMP